MTGTGLAQIISFLALPIITRLYSPEAFNLLAVYTSALGIGTAIACLCFEYAIPLPEDDQDAINILALALIISALFASTLLLIALMIPEIVAEALKQPKLINYIWMIPLGIWLGSSCSALQYWAVRKKNFGVIAKTRISQSIGSASTQIGYTFVANSSFLGLVLGQIINTSAGIIGLSKDLRAGSRSLLKKIKIRKIIEQIEKYKKFPQYTTFEVLLNNAGVQLPVIIIAAYALGPEAGYLLLATRAISIPVTLFGNAVSQVYFSQASDKMRLGELSEYTSKSIVNLIKAGVGPLICAGILAPNLFPMIFGADWQRAGAILTWMTPWYVMSFITSAVSTSLYVTNNQSLALWLQGAGFTIRVGLVAIAALFHKEKIVEVYALSSLLFYCIYYAAIVKVCRIDFSPIKKELTNAAIVVLVWIILGLLLSSLFFTTNLDA